MRHLTFKRWISGPGTKSALRYSQIYCIHICQRFRKIISRYSSKNRITWNEHMNDIHIITHLFDAYQSSRTVEIKYNPYAILFYTPCVWNWIYKTIYIKTVFFYKTQFKPMAVLKCMPEDCLTLPQSYIACKLLQLQEVGHLMLTAWQCIFVKTNRYSAAISNLLSRANVSRCI